MEESLLHDDFEIDDRIEPDVPPTQPLHNSAANSQPSQSSAQPNTGTWAPQGERFEQRRFTGGDTLDEPVLTTITRDLQSSFNILVTTLLKGGNNKAEWDLWGPLVFCLVLSLVLSVASSGSSSGVFSSVFAIVWLGQALLVFNIRLLGGTISYLHALSVTGYCLFPITVASLFSLVVKQPLVRLLVALGMIAWAVVSASKSLGSAGVLQDRVALASFPMGLFYFILGWMCVVV